MPCIRWSGGKRKQSEEIIARMPERFGTFWIPFLGGGSVMFQLLNSNIKFDRVVASDIYQPLMDLWILIRDEPDLIIEEYERMYNELMERGSDYYYEIVKEFNDQEYGKQSPILFHFITRSCMRGSMEYDKHGNFTTKFQSSSSDGDRIASPDSASAIIRRWSECMQDVEFRCESYECIVDEVQPDDFCFFDPPYIDGTWYHDHDIDMDKFYDFLRKLPCDYSITLNGDRDIYPIPDDCYTKHQYVYYGVRKSKSGRPTGSRDSLWMMKTDRYIYNDTNKNVRQNERVVGGRIPRVNDIKMMDDLQQQINNTNKKVDDMSNKLDMIIGMLANKS